MVLLKEFSTILKNHGLKISLKNTFFIVKWPELKKILCFWNLLEFFANTPLSV